MIDCKKIKDSENMPSGIIKIKDGGLAIDLDKIKSVFYDTDRLRIGYFDGTELHWYPAMQ